MSIFKKPFKIFNGKSWDEYHLKTDSTQVVHTKADGTDTTVAEQLLALNSTCICSRADNVTRTVSLPSGTNMTALHTYTCKKTGLHIIGGNINFSYASGGMRAYDISFGGNMKNITAQLGYSPDYATYIPVSCAAFLKAGDSIVFYARQNSGNTISAELDVKITY